MDTSPADIDPRTVGTETLVKLLRAWPITSDQKASVELLIGFSGGNLLDNPQLREFVSIYPGRPTSPAPYATVCWHKLSIALNGPATCTFTAAERYALLVASSLAVGDLAAVATHVDQGNKALILRAIAVALDVGGTAHIVHRMYEAERAVQQITALCDRADRAALGVDDVRDILGGITTPPGESVTNAARIPQSVHDVNRELAAQRNPQLDPVRGLIVPIVSVVRMAADEGIDEEGLRIAITRGMNITIPHPVTLQAALIAAINAGKVVASPNSDRYYLPQYAPTSTEEYMR